MVISYDEIVSDFLASIDDKKFLSLNESDAVEMMNAWLKSALSDPYVQKIFYSKTYDDEIREFTCELKRTSKDEQSDRDFVVKVLSMGMLIAWLQPQVTTTVNIHQMFGGKEEKFYSQSSHIDQLRGMLNDSKLALRKMIRDRSYIHNGYISGD